MRKMIFLALFFTAFNSFGGLEISFVLEEFKNKRIKSITLIAPDHLELVGVRYPRTYLIHRDSIEFALLALP